LANKEFPRGDILALVSLFRRSSRFKKRFLEDLFVEEAIDVGAFTPGLRIGSS